MYLFNSFIVWLWQAVILDLFQTRVRSCQVKFASSASVIIPKLHLRLSVLTNRQLIAVKSIDTLENGIILSRIWNMTNVKSDTLLTFTFSLFPFPLLEGGFMGLLSWVPVKISIKTFCTYYFQSVEKFTIKLWNNFCDFKVMFANNRAKFNVAKYK